MKRKNKDGRGSERGMSAGETRKIRRRKTGRRKNLLFFLVGLVLITILGFSLYRIVDLKMTQNELLAKQESLEQRKAELQDEIEHSDDPEYVERQARKLLNMVMPGEALYVLPD